MMSLNAMLSSNPVCIALATEKEKHNVSPNPD